MQHYKSKYPEKIIIIDSKKNKRQGGARNLGIKKARGEFIGFVDADDFVNENMYKIMFDKIHGTNANFVCVQIARVEENATLYDISSFTVPFLIWDENLKNLDGKELNDDGREILMVFSSGGTVSKLYRKDWILKNDLFFPEHLRYEDNYWATMMYAYVKKFFLIEKIMYYYRNNPDSTVNAIGSHHYIDRIEIEEKLNKDMKIKFDGKYKDALEYISVFRYFFNTFLLLIAKVKPMPWNVFEHIKKSLKENYPNFLKNKYVESMPRQWRTRLKFIYYFPYLYYYLFYIYKTLRIYKIRKYLP